MYKLLDSHVGYSPVGALALFFALGTTERTNHHHGRTPICRGSTDRHRSPCVGGLVKNKKKNLLCATIYCKILAITYTIIISSPWLFCHVSFPYKRSKGTRHFNHDCSFCKISGNPICAHSLTETFILPSLSSHCGRTTTKTRALVSVELTPSGIAEEFWCFRVPCTTMTWCLLAFRFHPRRLKSWSTDSLQRGNSRFAFSWSLTHNHSASHSSSCYRL